ncbi:hypothetical protein ACFV29_42990 [Streptomyces sp. NPDC059690]|uniref:hypothetical protein n=1 Tax=Streptomyces sp. NPDC059690 TaxID=3346907 RepID=UPI00368B36FB
MAAAQAAQPYDDRCLSWQYDQRTVSIWTVDGRVITAAGAVCAKTPDQEEETDLLP